MGSPPAERSPVSKAVVGHRDQALASDAAIPHGEVLAKKGAPFSPVLGGGECGELLEELVPRAEHGELRELCLGAYGINELVFVCEGGPRTGGLALKGAHADLLRRVGVDARERPVLAGDGARTAAQRDHDGGAVPALEAHGEADLASRPVEGAGRAGDAEILLERGHRVDLEGKHLVEGRERLIGDDDVSIEVLREVVCRAGRARRARGRGLGSFGSRDRRLIGRRLGRRLGVDVLLDRLGGIGDGELDGRLGRGLGIGGERLICLVLGRQLRARLGILGGRDLDPCLWLSLDCMFGGGVLIGRGRWLELQPDNKRFFRLLRGLDLGLRLRFRLRLDVLRLQRLHVLHAALSLERLRAGGILAPVLLGAGERLVVLLVCEHGHKDGALLENGDLDALAELLKEAAGILEAEVGGGEAVGLEHLGGAGEGGLLSDTELAAEQSIQV